MATAQTIIDRACRLLGAIEAGESATTDESADGLTALNALLDSWRNDRLMCYSLTATSKAMVVSDASYTFASGGDFNAERPTEIVNAYMTIDGVDYPVRILTPDEWYAIEDKTVTGTLVEKVWYNPTYPNGTVNVWPVPSATNTLTLVAWTPLTAIATVGTSISLPPGWERALAYNLAVEIAPEFQTNPSAIVVRTAANSLRGIKNRNATPIKSFNDLAPLVNTPREHILLGQ